MSNQNELTTDVEQTENKCILKVRSKRGTGTNDRDRVDGTLVRDTLDEVEAERSRLIENVKEAMAEARAFQPDADEDDE